MILKFKLLGCQSELVAGEFCISHRLRQAQPDNVRKINRSVHKLLKNKLSLFIESSEIYLYL